MEYKLLQRVVWCHTHLAKDPVSLSMNTSDNSGDDVGAGGGGKSDDGDGGADGDVVTSYSR